MVAINGTDTSGSTIPFVAAGDEPAEFKDHHVFHQTEMANARSVSRTGINPAYTVGGIRPDERLLKAVTQAHDRTPPVDRCNSSFFRLTYDTAAVGWVQSMVLMGVFVVDVREVSAPMAVADASLFASITEATPDEFEDDDGFPQEAVAPAEAYLDAMVEVDSALEARTVAQECEGPELIIGGVVPPSAIEMFVYPPMP